MTTKFGGAYGGVSFVKQDFKGRVGMEAITLQLLNQLVPLIHPLRRKYLLLLIHLVF